MKYGTKVMPFQGNLDAIIFIPIVSTFLKWLRFKFQMKLKID
jgi:hypothetical protein